LDGDNDIYSAVLVHSSDTGAGGGLPGIDEQTGCQYTHRVEAKYSVKFDFVGAGPLIEPEKITGTLPADQKLREKVLKTAVVEFTERGDLGIRDAGAIVAEWMTTALNKTGVFEVYERLSFNKLMEEHKLGMSGLMEEETIAKIGKMRGVDAIVTGSVIKFGDIISVTAKLIDTETAKIIDSGDIKVTDVNRISLEIGKLALELATK
jgi:TolB-like protein